MEDDIINYISVNREYLRMISKHIEEYVPERHNELFTRILVENISRDLMNLDPIDILLTLEGIDLYYYLRLI